MTSLFCFGLVARIEFDHSSCTQRRSRRRELAENFESLSQLELIRLVFLS